MRFGRSKFYHWRAKLLWLDLSRSDCETQFIARKLNKEKRFNTKKTEEGTEFAEKSQEIFSLRN